MKEVKVRRWNKLDIERGTRVLLRLELNVPMKSGKMMANEGANYRLEQALPELRALRARGACVIILAHLGDPGGQRVQSLSLKPVIRWLGEAIKQEIKLLEGPTDPETVKTVNQMAPGEIVALENIRFWPGEEKNDSTFVKELASLGQVFVNNAFGVMHRAQASVTGLPRYLPAFAGELVAREVAALTGAWPRPAIAIQGGAKLALKLPLLQALLNEVQDIYVGGALAIPLAVAAGQNLPKKILTAVDPRDIKAAQALLDIGRKQLRIPVDFTLDQTLTRVLDVGPRTVEEMVFGLQQAKALFWNGPLGVIEESLGQKATLELGRAIGQAHLKMAIAGGGETVDFLRANHLTAGFTHLSTGGGAALALVAGEELPGLVTLR
jgi:phosphoglycerate kinase